MERLFDMLSLDIEQARSVISSTPDAFGLTDLRPFVERPLLKLGSTSFACPYQGFLRNQLGLGLFYVIFDKYRTRGDDSNLRLSQFFGRFLETYLFGVVSDATRRRKDAHVFPEKKYLVKGGESKSSDVILVAGSNAVFIEITRSRLRLDETICRRDRKSLDEDIERIFVRKARELDRSIKDFKSGAFQLNGVNPATIKNFFPVITTEQDFPQLIALPQLIRSAIAGAGYLGQWKDVQVFAAEDIEALYVSSDGNLELERMLDKKITDPKYRYRDLPTYLYDLEPDKLAPRGDKSLPGYRELFDNIVIPTLRRWGLPTTEVGR